MDLLTKVNNYYTSTASADFISYLLTYSTRKFVNYLPKEILSKYSDSIEVTSEKTNIYDKILIEVIVSGKEPRLIPYSKFMQAKDVNSIYYASTFDPVASIKGNYIYVYPTEAEIVYYQYPNVSATDLQISPIEIEDLVILDVVLSLINIKFKEFLDLVNSITIDKVEPPLLPEPNFIYTNPIFKSIVETIGDNITPPTYSLTLNEVSSIDITIPSLPNLDNPAFAIYIADAEIGLNVLDIDSLYNNLASAIDEEDLELAGTIIGQIQTKIGQWNNAVNLYLQSKQTNSSEAQIELNKQIAEYQNLITRFNSELEKTFKDIEFQIAISKLNVDIAIANTNTKLQNESNKFSAEMEVYKTKISENLEKVKISQERLSLISKTENDFNLVNEAKQLETQLAEYQAQLTKFQNEVAIYTQQVVEEFNKKKFEIEKINVELGFIKNLYEQYRIQFDTLLQLILGVRNGSIQKGNMGNDNITAN